MRSILVLTIILGSLPFCFLRPWVGVLVFAWISYMNPHRYTWGLAYDFPVAMVVAAATLLGVLFTRDRSPAPWTRETLLLLALWGVFTLTTPIAINQAGAWEQWVKVSKILLMTFVTLVVINNPRKLRYLLLTIALSIGLLGLKGGLFTIMTGGEYRVRGPAGSFIGGEADFALALNMTLPLLFYLSKDEPRVWLRHGLKTLFWSSVVATVFTYSRGGLLALLLVGFYLLLKARRKSLAILTLVAATVLLAVLVPTRWTQRMETIQTYEQDASAQGRINAWWTAWNLALDRPLTGGGFETFFWPVFDRYAPDSSNVRDVHSVYFEMLGEHGFPGLLLFLSLIASSLLSLRRLRKTLARDPGAGWARHYPDMLQVSIMAYLLGGAFLGRAYFDFFYHLVAATIILKTLGSRGAAAPAESGARAVRSPSANLALAPGGKKPLWLMP